MGSRARLIGAVAVAVAGLLVGRIAAGARETGSNTPAVYEQLRHARLRHAGRVHAQSLRIDRFQLTLSDGNLYLLEPVAGRSTGAVFVGKGTIRAFPPDAVEHQQLKKILDADLIEDRFEHLVLRFSDDLGERLQALVEQGPDPDFDAARRVFEDQLEARFKDQLENPDSRIAFDLIDRERGVAWPGGRPSYVLALVDGADRGWFAVEIEPRRIEEVLVSRYSDAFEATDVWMSCHAVTDVAAEGAGGFDPFAGFPVDPASLTVRRDKITGLDLGLPQRPARPNREGWTSDIDMPLVTSDMAIDSQGLVRATVALLIEPRRELAALRFRISPWLHVTDVRLRSARPGITTSAGNGTADLDLLSRTADPDAQPESDPAVPVSVAGERLHFIQERRARRMTDDWFEPWITVALPRAVQPGQRIVLEFAYEGKLLERLRGGGSYVLKDTVYWMPVPPDDRLSRFLLTFRTRERDSVVSTGDLVDDRVMGKARIVRRAMRSPAFHASFHYGRFDATTVREDGLPPITVYEDRYRLGTAPGTLQKTVADLAGALRTGRDYFGEIPVESIQATETPSTTGQAFPGFLLLSSVAFGELHTGESELFRAHEVGHQWWGVGVNWRAYRDQWLSEGFAQYGAALYVLNGLGDERKFRDIISAWRDDVTGVIDIGQGNGRHYGFRPSVIRKSKGAASGALVVGYRLRTTKTPYDYRLLVYEKGAFILHMLRSMLLDPQTGDDTRFRLLMRGFASEQIHRLATTDDFERAVSAAFGESMSWFFDQWVYGVEVPIYRPDLRVIEGGGGTPFRLTGRIRQEEVRPGFRMPVPIAFHFADRPMLIRSVWVDKESVNVDIPLPARPEQVEFDYQSGVLAKIR